MSAYSQSFLATWGIYPKRNRQKRGKSTAFAEWEKLPLEDQRKAYADIRARNNAGAWEYVRDLERYLKRREWEDEWQGAKVTSDPDLVGQITSVTLEEVIDYALEHRNLCRHQIRNPWSYYGPEPGLIAGAVIPECKACEYPMQRVQAKDIPLRRKSA